jgi:ComF family protein
VTAGLTPLAGGLLDLIFPPRCVGCRRPGSDLCPGCRQLLRWQPGPLCPGCGRPAGPDGRCGDCRQAPFALEGLRSALDFAGPVRAAIHQFKYRGRRRLTPLLVELMLTAWRSAPLAVDLVVPVPLHPARQAERGYNQAALLAAAFAAVAGLPCAPHALSRTRATRPQAELDARQRRRNVADAFRAESLVAGRRVLLVDDVCTTGATLGDCARALRAAGSAGVWAFTLARAVWDPEQGTAADAVTAGAAVAGSAPAGAVVAGGDPL